MKHFTLILSSVLSLMGNWGFGEKISEVFSYCFLSELKPQNDKNGLSYIVD
jgi:hypothetical protein